MVFNVNGIDRNHFEIKPNAQQSEIFAYFLLKDNVFKNKKTYVGDSTYTPDIYTYDYKIGVEVVRCENPSTFYYYAHIFNDPNYVFDKTKLRFVYKKNSNKRFKIALKYKTNSPFYLAPSTMPKVLNKKQEFINALIYNLNQKHKKLNAGNYNSCQSKNLFIFSDYEKKDYISVEEVVEICQEIRSQFPKTFDKIYLAMNSKLYQIEKDGSFELIKNEQFMQQKKKELDYDFYL